MPTVTREDDAARATALVVSALPRGASCQAILELLLSVLVERTDNDLRQRDKAHADIRLRAVTNDQPNALADAIHAPVHEELAADQVNVFPMRTEDLTATQAGAERDGHQCAEAIIANDVEKTTQVRNPRRLMLRATDARPLDKRCDVSARGADA